MLTNWCAGFTIDDSYRVGFLDVYDCAGAEPGPTRPCNIPVILDADIDGDRDEMAAAIADVAQEYSTCKSWPEVVEGENLRYAPVLRVSDPGTKDQPAYTGFWFYDGLQFDESNRDALAMKVYFQGRDVTPSDRGEIGYIDLEDKNKWTKIGETLAWNWQQGCRLTWPGGLHEILWNDLADDVSHFVCRAYHFKTGARRTLPRAIYDVSRDGAFALTHDFQRMRHGKSTNYVGIRDRHEGQIAPAEIGV